MTFKKESIEKQPSIQKTETAMLSEPESESISISGELTEEEGNTGINEKERERNRKPIRELTPAEKRKKALLAKTRLRTYDFVTIPEGASWEIETTFDKVELKQVRKYKSEELEWKLVVKAIVPHIDPNTEVELRFTPKQGDKLQKELERGYTHIQVTRNNEKGTKTEYTFVGLD